MGIHLDLKAKVPGISKEDFAKCAEDARENCPVSQAMKAVPITMTAVLV